MKKLYKTPIVIAEELRRGDILCASGEINPNVNDNFNLSGKEGAPDTIYDLTDIL
ncbi:MAG: hypothetical protein IJT79_05950 [Ruminococcus sp.]|nr:hypothetical protein [Ruminococcus sp.]